ncbi:MAG: hypothetical protein ACXWF6_01920 [Usitatibacter sp.]
MDRTTVFTKTAKGITQVNQKSASLSKDLMRVLKLIDGKSNFGQIMEKAELDKMQLEKALNSLSKDGYARVFQVRKEEADPFAGEDDFDFTAPGKMPASTQRVIPGAANDISELVRQQEKQDSDKKSREQAHEQARVKAKAEAESRAKLEAEARAKVEAEQKAMEQAKRAKEASERAKAELEAQMREEEARKRVLADQQAQARLTSEQKSKEAEESKRLAEIRAKAERDAKALAEARARAEAEAQAMARARAEAEAAAKRQATQATGAEAELKARLKEEIEARIRSEMEELLRNEFEDKTRAEMQSQIMAEARLAAKAELEERLREERQALAGAEMEARKKAELESRARADNEAKLRAQAEARAAAETEARIKAEEESRRLRREAERAREEAGERAKEQEETNRRLEAERRGKIEAEARAEVEAEERERREKELQGKIEAERKAKEEAEMRARIEARARETIAEDTRAKVQAEIEGDMTKRAEIEGKAQAKAYMHAKAKAESDEDERLRGEQARRAKEIASVLRTKVEPDEAAPTSAPSARRRARKKGSIVKPVFYSLLASLLLAIVALHLVPLRAYTVKVERAMSAWLHDDVSIGSMTFRLIPTPHLKVENVAVGKLLDAKASSGRIYMDIATLFGEKPNINSIELDNVTISSEAVKRIPIWGRPEGKTEGGGIDTIKLRGVTLDVKPAIGAFDANLSFARNGALRVANLSSQGAWTLGLKPVEKGIDLDFFARNWTLPLGAALPVSEVKLAGNWTGNEIVVPEFEADAMEGKVQGTLRVTWGQQGVKLESELSVTKVLAKELVAAFTKDISVSGKVDGNFSLVTEGPTVEQLFAAPHGQGKFRVGEGSISNIDLVAVMQSDAAGQRAGVTKFAELTGEMSSADHHASYRNVALQGGVLRGNGNIDIGANSALSGRLLLEIRSQVAQDKGAFSVSGTVGRPIIRRGG